MLQHHSLVTGTVKPEAVKHLNDGPQSLDIGFVAGIELLQSRFNISVVRDLRQAFLQLVSGSTGILDTTRQCFRVQVDFLT